jgi:hypothetical protein
LDASGFLIKKDTLLDMLENHPGCGGDGRDRERERERKRERKREMMRQNNLEKVVDFKRNVSMK